MSLVEFERATDAPLHASVARRTSVDIIALCDDYWRLAQRISNTEFVPTSLRRRPEAVLAALLSGAERGLGPMESLRSIHVIEGRPNLSAEAMRALVFAAGHDIEIVETSAQKATVIGRRAGSTNTSPPFTWTIDRARRARLLQKDNWQKYPESMLLARATADLCRALFPDVTAGLAVTEEVADELAPEPATATASTTRKRRPAVAPVSAPVPSIETTANDTAPTVVEPVSEHTAADSTFHMPPMVDAEDGETPYDIPGSDQPSWAPDPTPAAKPKLDQKRFHAAIAQAFPDADRGTRDRWRHALVAVVTRRRNEGPTTSSAELETDEQLALSELVERIKAGTVTVADEPDARVAVRASGGWRADVTLEGGHLGVIISRDETSDVDEAGDE